MSDPVLVPVPVVRDMPQERDYAWKNPDPGLRPSGPQHFRDLPIVGNEVVEEVAQVYGALSQLSIGQFLMAGALADSMMGDDRIAGCMTTRLDALASLPLEVAPRNDGARAKGKAERLVEEWPEWVPDSELKRILFWGRMVNLGIGEILWNADEAGYWKPRVKAWDPRYVFWRWDTRSFWIVTWDGMVELRPGDGHWILFCPQGYARGWMHSIIRPLAMPFLWRQWAMRDWARYSEVHGLPIKKLRVPSEASTEDKELIKQDLLTLGSEGLIRLPRADSDPDGGYDLELCEPQAQSFEGFARLVAKADECIAITVLGQNLTTSAGSGGSYALGAVHDGIRRDRLESDAKSIGECFDEQLIRPWAVYNFGDEKLGPHARWSTKAIDDRAQTAKTFLDLGSAIKALKDAGLPVDLAEVAKQFRVPLAAVVNANQHGQLYEYHLRYGVVTKNEARARLALPPRDDGDALATPLAPAPHTPPESDSDAVSK